MNIPNTITFARFLIVPVIVYCLGHDMMAAAFYLFALAGISDGVDGLIARRFHMQTKIGAWLDPLADKALMVAVYVMLGMLKFVPDWLVFLIVTRDIFIMGAVATSALAGNALEVKPLFVSKANTAMQIFLAVFVIGSAAFDVALLQITWILTALTAVLTIASGAAYLLVWSKHIVDSHEEGA